MLFVLPVCDKEIKQASHLAAWLHMLGGMEKTRCLVVQTWKAQWEISPIINSLRTTFGTVDAYQPPLEDESGWPISSNTFFQQTAEYLEESGNTEPWFWWECDVAPLSPGYWAALTAEHKISGKPYMGTINQSQFMYVRDVVKDGVAYPKGHRFFKGRHMVGAGIYPADFWRRCAGVRTLPELAFDVALGPEIEPFCHDSKLIAHRWQTHKYHRNPEGLLTMEDVDPDDNLYGGRPIPPDAIAVHGCKDTSLIDLLIREHLLRSRKEVG